MTDSNIEPKPKIKLFLKMISWFPNIKKNLWRIIILLAINTALTVLQPYFYKLFIDKIEFFTKNRAENIFWELGKISILFATSVILLVVFKYIYRLTIAKLIYIDRTSLLIETAKKFIELPMSYHINKNTSEKIKIYDRWTGSLFWMSFNLIIDIIPTVIIIIILAILGFYINFKMTLISFSFFPIMLIGIFYIGKKVTKKQTIIDNDWDDAFSRFWDSMVNINILKIFTREKQEINLLKEKFETATKKQFTNEYIWALLMNFLSTCWTVAQVIVIITGTFFIIKNEMTLGDLFMFIAINNQIYSSLMWLFWSWDHVIKSFVSYEKLDKIIHLSKDKDDWIIEKLNFQDKIIFENVTFNYPNIDREVLKNINLEIKKWEKIALVWHTGSGKTTIVNLLTRFYENSKWNILIDWEKIENYKLETYRQKFAQVFQDNTLFNDTILNNLKFVNSQASQKDIEKACQEAQILEFIQSLEKWFDTIVWERWLKLSGWEKQRIAVARALLANPEILILDEATSALDSKTENDIQIAFENLMKWRTSLIIAHRLSTIKNVDKIIVLDKWEVVSVWTHSELYSKSSLYKEMVDLQKYWFID